ncbi:MAG: ABC transporter ATP-binding protein [Micrococcaceae bacterium]
MSMLGPPGGRMRARRKPGEEPVNLTAKEYLGVILRAVKLVAKIAPGVIAIELINAAITAMVPLAMASLGARTITALHHASNGGSSSLIESQTVFTLVLITAGLSVFQTFWSSITGYINNVINYKVTAKVGDMMYERFASLEFWRYDDKDTIDTYDRAQRFVQTFTQTFSNLTSVLSSIITLVTAAFMLFFTAPILVILLIVSMIPGMYLQMKLTRIQMEHWNKHVDERRVIGSIERQMLSHDKISEIRLYGLVRHILDLRMEKRDADQLVSLQYEKSFIPKKLGADLIEAAAQVGALIWTIKGILAKTIDIGKFTLVQQVIQQCFSAGNTLVNTLSTLDQQLSYLREYEKFLAYPVDKPGEIPLKDEVETIDVEDLYFRYPQVEDYVIKGMNMNIKRGQRVAIVGENGAGKTTFIKLLSGLYRPSRGSIKVNGIDLRNINVADWHRHIAVLRQDYLSFDFATVRDNIEFGDIENRGDEARMLDAANRAEAGFLDYLPAGYNSYVSPWMVAEDGTPGTNLSGGQWQRLAFARSIYRNAPILILDEPTSAMDALAESRIFKGLFKEDKTLIMVSHRLSTIQKADMVFMCEDGKIVEQGTYEQLVQLQGRFYRMFESQLNRSELSAGS